MKCVVIAAGYATRLYPLTENYPKPLLKIGNNSILGRMVDDIDTINAIDEIVVVSNHKFAKQFEDWAEQLLTRCTIRILDDGTSTNEARLGAVRDLLLAIDVAKVNDDMLVVAADNLLDFSFNGFVEFALQKQTSCIMCHYEPEIYKLQRTGVIAVDEDMRVLRMQEKPEMPVSHWAVPPFYVYLQKDLPLICECLEHGCGFDAPGNLAHYLVDHTTLHAWQMPGHRFDIGSLDTYYKAQKLFENK